MTHSYESVGACEACGETIAGCRLCAARSFGQKGCSCPFEPIHLTRALRHRLAIAAAAAPPAALEQGAAKP